METGFRKLREVSLLPVVKLDFKVCPPNSWVMKEKRSFLVDWVRVKSREPLERGNAPCVMGSKKDSLSERAPNLFDIPARSKTRLDEPNYHKGDPASRPSVQKEAFEGSGTAENGQEYIAESHACPNCYVVPGFGVKGTNDTESPMPRIHKPPISLSMGELAAVDTWMYVREGLEAPGYEEIVASYEKFIP